MGHDYLAGPLLAVLQHMRKNYELGQTGVLSAGYCGLPRVSSNIFFTITRYL